MIWLGLIVTLLSALVGCLADLKQPKEVPKWWPEFFRRNRIVLISALLALVGFLVAVLAVREERLEARVAQADLETEKQNLQLLLLRDVAFAPVVELGIDTGDPELEQRLATEGSDDKAQVGVIPEQIGYLQKPIIEALFPAATPDSLLHLVGTVDLRTARGDWRINFQVRKDGSIIAGNTNRLTLDEVRTGLVDDSRAIIELLVADELEATEILQALIKGHEKRVPPLTIRVFGTSSPPSKVEEDTFSSKRGRLTIYLDLKRTTAVTALLEAESIEYSQGTTTYRWRYAEAPHFASSLPGGRH